ncbi:MAG: hypothetical protein LQ349_006284 [Xanthoria aureola]|nr:MAG: hypothetical protein LQ349_006284 [Xanthoria aureola]
MGDPMDHSIAEGFVVLDASGKTAPNGKPAGPRSAQDVKPLSEQVSGTTSADDQGDEEGQGTLNGSTSEPDLTLPPGWEERTNKGGRRYFVDHNTRTTTWVRPIPGDEKTSKPLPKGWERGMTDDGTKRIYFVDHNTKRNTWTMPEHPAESAQVSHDPDEKDNSTVTDSKRE